MDKTASSHCLAVLFMQPADIEEFKTLYEKHFGVKLSEASAAQIANNILRFYKSVYKQ